MFSIKDEYNIWGQYRFGNPFGDFLFFFAGITEFSKGGGPKIEYNFCNIDGTDPVLDDEQVKRLKEDLARSQEQSLPTDNAFQLAGSVSDKITKMCIAYQDVHAQGAVWLEEKKRIEEQGVGSAEPGIRLSLRYETYLNTIYSLCESLSKIVIMLFLKDDLPKGLNILPEGFNKQKKNSFYRSFPMIRIQRS